LQSYANKLKKPNNTNKNNKQKQQMKEEFLHYVWKNGFFKHEELKTTQNQRVKIISKGFHNHNAGPDFLNAKIVIDDILWVGNIEMHKSSSDWYAHGHEKDPAYDNVILHVVYDDNMPVYNSNNVEIATLVLSKYVYKGLLKNYNKLIKTKAILRCQNDIGKIDRFTVIHYKYRLFFERLEDKYTIVKSLLNQTHNDWNQVLYETLLKYFGGNVNKEAFEMLAKFLPYQVFIKHKDSIFQLEALLFGVSGFLMGEKDDSYYSDLKKEYAFLKEKYNLKEMPDKVIKFHRLRPLNFPTIRLAQFAQLCAKNNFLFEKLMNIKNKENTYELFDINAGDYWKTHYSFNKSTKSKNKKIGKDFIDHILINVIIPLKFAYQKHFDTYNEDEIINLIESIKPEKNRIVTTFNKINLIAKNALDTQAIIQLNQKYCSQNKCLSCEIAFRILKKGLLDEVGER